MARLALAERAIQAAFRLRPEAGEAHLARAENLYRGHLDYEGALAELEAASQTLPNSPSVFALKGYIQRRQGHWEESMRNFEQAIDLDPRNFSMLQQFAIGYGVLRRYAEEKSVLDRALSIAPNDVDTKVARASVEFHWKADTQSLHQAIDAIRATDPAALPNIANDWLSCALAERDVAAAKDALNAFGEVPLTDYAVHLNRPLMEGVIARMTKDDKTARAAFTAARAEQEKAVQAQPNYAPPLCVLGLIDAGLGSERRSAARRPARGRASSGGKRCNQWPAYDRVFGNDRCMGWREGTSLRTACNRRSSPEHRQLWPAENYCRFGIHCGKIRALKKS